MAAKPKSKRASRSPAKPSRKKSAQSKSVAQKSRSKVPKKNLSCPIVGIGGSAGGFEAVMELLRYLPPKTGMAYVIVQHLDPHHASRLPTLLGRVTQMPVIEVNGSVKVEPNIVYVQPSNQRVSVKGGSFKLVGRTERLNLGIDHFFESLAEEQGSRAIGVVLSGTGSDGTAGLRAIKAAGGLSFAQDESAKFAAMPRHAIQSGFVDAALSPREIAEEIQRISKHPYIRKAEDESEEHVDLDDLGRIFQTLKRHTGVDFSAYKQSTLHRRIERRMALHRIEALGQYARYLRDHSGEVNALFNDLLINVTRFFRDSGVFQALTKRFLPALIKNKGRKGELRVWVPGCATGEEVYSLAICIIETLSRDMASTRVQIFGTDLSEHAIDRARLGVYSSAIEKDVSRERLERFFKKLDSTYEVNRMVRDLCTFARQNITADPPFSHIDLISCRNVLIYLGPQLQKRCVPIFHYALNPGGYLLLGPSETVGVFGELFEMVDKRNKIYAKKIVSGRPELPLRGYGAADFHFVEKRKVAPPAEGKDFNAQVQQMADRILLGAYAPSGVVIDANMQVRHFRGQTGRYLEHAHGAATLHLLQMARPDLIADLRTAINRAVKTNQTVRKERAMLRHDSSSSQVTIEVMPFKLPTVDTKFFLVIFHDTGAKAQAKPAKFHGKAAGREIAALGDELNATKESLQAIIEEQEATNEELKSANEEIESSNEELQSTNEELETAKEELQSTNEELTTLNEELSNRNIEITQVNSDLNNLLSSTHLPIVMVDNNLTIRRATPTSRDVFNITDTDVGRRITELKPNISITDLEKLLREVIDTLVIRECDVRDKRGRAYSLRVRPYRTADNKIDGAVLTLVDMERKPEDRANKAKSR